MQKRKSHVKNFTEELKSIDWQNIDLKLWLFYETQKFWQIELKKTMSN